MSTEIFKVGDPVFDIHYGWGKVIDSINKEYTTCSFDSCTVEYANPICLSFTEYDLISGGWSQDRSVLNQPKKGQLVYVRDSNVEDWLMCFFSHKKGEKFFCFQEQKKEGDTNYWRYLEVENPLLKEKE